MCFNILRITFARASPGALGQAGSHAEEQRDGDPALGSTAEQDVENKDERFTDGEQSREI